MLIGFEFGARAQAASARSAPRRVAAARCGTRRPEPDHGLRATRSRAPRCATQSTASSASPRSPTKRSSRGAGFALVFLGFISLVLAVINLFPFLPLDGGHVLWALAEKVRGRRISLAAMCRYSSVGHRAARCSWSSTASATTSAASAADARLRRRSARSGRTHTQLLTSAPTRSAQRRPEQRLELGAAQQLDLLPAAGRPQPPVAPAQRRAAASARPAAASAARSGTSSAGVCTNQPRADAAQLRGERRAARRRHVLDHARAVHEVELAVGERQPVGRVGAHERPRIAGALDEVDAGDVELGLERRAARARRSRRRAPACAGAGRGEREEALVAARARAARANGSARRGSGPRDVGRRPCDGRRSDRSGGIVESGLWPQSARSTSARCRSAAARRSPCRR